MPDHQASIQSFDQRLAMKCKLNIALLVMKLSVQRVVAAAVVGVLFGSYNHHMYVTWSSRGKDEFISHQGHRFDMYMAHPRH